MDHKKTIVTMLACLLLAAAANVAAQSPTPTPPARLPNPVLYLTGVEYYSANGKNWTRYKYGVANFSAYPDTLFAASPNLPPCGQNTKSSRSWVDFFDSRGKRLYGFCALDKAAGLNKIWFAVETGIVPPSYVYIEITDRETNTKYKSNLADTVE
ncbi:MAG TPA: hypothetical protein VIT88_04730 [Pyrinomonadaceae bacterium]